MILYGSLGTPHKAKIYPGFYIGIAECLFFRLERMKHIQILISLERLILLPSFPVDSLNNLDNLDFWVRGANIHPLYEGE